MGAVGVLAIGTDLDDTVDIVLRDGKDVLTGGNKRSPSNCTSSSVVPLGNDSAVDIHEILIDVVLASLGVFRPVGIGRDGIVEA